MPKTLPKLVRDRIPEVLKAKGLDPMYHQAEECRRVPLLIDKLEEEIAELKAAKTEGERYEEMADILEVAAALQASFDRETLGQVRLLKAVERGGFEKLIVLVD